MTLRVIYIFRGLQVYVLSTSKRLPTGSPNADIYPMSQPLDPLKILIEARKRGAY